MKEKTEDPNYQYSTPSKVQLGNSNQAHLGRFPDVEGERTEGNNYIAFSLLMLNGGIVDYDYDEFEDENSAKVYLSMLKQEDNKYERKGMIVPIEQRAETEKKIINLINTGNINKNSEHDGQLPKSDPDAVSGSPYYAE